MDFLQLAEQFIPNLKDIGINKPKRHMTKPRPRVFRSTGSRRYHTSVADPCRPSWKHRSRTSAATLGVKPIVKSPSKPTSTRQFIDRALNFIDSSINDTDHLAILQSAFNEINNPLDSVPPPSPKRCGEPQFRRGKSSKSAHHGHVMSKPKACHSDSSAFTNQQCNVKYPELNVSFQTHRQVEYQKNAQVRRRSNIPKRSANEKFEKARFSAPLLHMKMKGASKPQMSDAPLLMRPPMAVKVGPEAYTSVEEMTSNLASSIKTLKTMNRNYTRMGGSIMSALKTIRAELKELKKKTDQLSSESKASKKKKRINKKEVSNTSTKPKNVLSNASKGKKPVKKPIPKKKEIKKSQSEPQIGLKPVKKEGRPKPVKHKRPETQEKKKDEDFQQLYPSKNQLKEKQSGGTQTNKRFLFMRGSNISKPSNQGLERILAPKTTPLRLKPLLRKSARRLVPNQQAFNKALVTPMANKRCTLENLKEVIHEKEVERKKTTQEAKENIEPKSSLKSLTPNKDQGELVNFDYGCLMAPP